MTTSSNNQEFYPRNYISGTFQTLLSRENKRFNKKNRKEESFLKEIAIDIEKGVYNKIINLAKQKNIPRKWDNKIFLDLYKAAAISVYSNLDSKSYIKNDRLFKRLVDGEFSGYELATMKHQQSYPELNHYQMKKVKRIEISL